MPKISVIIPVYNVEKTMRQTLDSVINQTFKDIQIICVNDCSTDSSVQILEEYASKDSCIEIYHNEKNLGLGLTRNHGMEYAKGDYIHFLDADDWLEKDAYEILIAKTADSPDVINFLWNNVNSQNGKIRKEKFKHNIKGCTNLSQNPEITDDWGVSVWHRIYRREFLNKYNLIFNDYRCMEDVEFLYKVLADAEKIEFVDKRLLNYRTNNPNSLIGKFAKYYQCVIDSYNTIYEYSKKLSPESRDIILAKLYNSVLYKLLGSFCAGVLSIDDLKKYVLSVDYSVFLNDKKTYKWYGFYSEIMNCCGFMIKFRYNLKLFLKNNLYAVYETLRRG
ncbi:glycosyltransferase family 2 protein [bacterium]|nr:glycosyltransferase family 2 protein [bacterium]